MADRYTPDNPSEPITEDAGLHLSSATMRPAVGMVELFTTFIVIGSTTFGGLWASSQKLEQVLVNRRRWMTLEEQRTLMIAATLIPAPKFLSFGGLVGYQLCGWRGSVMTVVALVFPGTVMVLAGAMLVNPETVGDALGPISRAVEIGVVGVLLGNAYHQIRGARAKQRNKAIGLALTLGVTGATMLGVPMLAAAAAGLAIGALALRKKKTAPSPTATAVGDNTPADAAIADISEPR
jgi:chromate transporter